MKEIIVDADVSQFETVNAQFEEYLEEINCDMKTSFQLQIVLEELFVNVANYAYGEQTGKLTIQFDFHEAEHKLLIVFSDSGVAFDPLQKEDIDVDEKSMDDSIGGLGIHMVKNMVDQIHYQRIEDRNVLSIEKIIAG